MDIDNGGAEVFVVVVAVPTCVEAGVGETGWGWHLNLPELSHADAARLKKGGGEEREVRSRTPLMHVQRRTRPGFIPPRAWA